jgi:hypothetical protein
LPQGLGEQQPDDNWATIQNKNLSGFAGFGRGAVARTEVIDMLEEIPTNPNSFDSRTGCKTANRL